MLPLINKVKFKDLVVKLGYESFVPTRYRSFDEVKYPCVVKLNPLLGAFGQGVHIVQNATMLRQLAPTMHGVLLEEYIPSGSRQVEMIVNVVAYKGRVLSIDKCIEYSTYPTDTVINAVSFKQFKRALIKCDTTLNGTVVKPIAEKIVSKLNFNGIGFIQLKYDEQNMPKFVEMNGRADAAMSFWNHGLLASFIKTYYDAWKADGHPKRTNFI